MYPGGEGARRTCACPGLPTLPPMPIRLARNSGELLRLRRCAAMTWRLFSCAPEDKDKNKDTKGNIITHLGKDEGWFWNMCVRERERESEREG